MLVFELLIIYGASAAYVGRPRPITDVRVSTNCSRHEVPAALIETSLTTALGMDPYPKLTMTHVVGIAPTSTTSSSSAGSTSYMAIVDEWRAKLGLADFTRDAGLEANALKTCIDGNSHMVHELNRGTHAQVLAPGDIYRDFENIFVGGWLCEKPDMKGLDGICTKMSVGWYYTSTGHADILTSKIYTRIGCATSDGITGCDLA
jgi:hypothetical protein